MRLMVTGLCLDLCASWGGGRVYDYSVSRAGRERVHVGDVALSFFSDTKKKGRAGVAHPPSRPVVLVAEEKKKEIGAEVAVSEEKVVVVEETAGVEKKDEEIMIIIENGRPVYGKVDSETMTGSSIGRPSTISSTFYISLSAEERRALEGDAERGLEPMPEFFRSKPCEDNFAAAYEFFKRSGISVSQRLVAKRWIVEHLRDLEYALQPVEWARFPLARRYYQAIVDPAAKEEEEAAAPSTPPPPSLHPRTLLDDGAVGRGPMAALAEEDDGGFERL